MMVLSSKTRGGQAIVKSSSYQLSSHAEDLGRTASAITREVYLCMGVGASNRYITHQLGMRVPTRLGMRTFNGFQKDVK